MQLKIKKNTRQEWSPDGSNFDLDVAGYDQFPPKVF